MKPGRDGQPRNIQLDRTPRAAGSPTDAMVSPSRYRGMSAGAIR